MSLQVVHLRRLEPGSSQGVPHHLFLCLSVGHRQPLAGSVLVHGCTANDAPDAVAIGNCIAQTLQNNDAAAFPRTYPLAAASNV